MRLENVENFIIKGELIMKKRVNWLALVPVVSGLLALAVDFIIQPKLDSEEQERMQEENKQMIQDEVQRQLALTK